MSATEDDGVDEGVLCHEFVEGVLHEVVGTGLVELVVFDQRHPHGTGLPHDGGAWVKFLDFKIVGLGFDGSFGGKHPDVLGVGKLSDDFGCGTDDP